MSVTEEVVLYDVPSRDTSLCFSPNVWKARAALNFKNMPYRTEWLAYTELTKTAMTWNVPPNTPQESLFPYTVPAIKLPDGTHLMESLRIAKKLEEMKPQPSLRLDTQHHKRAIEIVTQLQTALVPPFVYRVARLMNTNDAEFIMKERTRQMGQHPLDLAKDPEKSGEAAWKNAKLGIERLKELLSENAEGPYVMGREMGFADIVIVAAMKMFEKIDEDGDIYGRLIQEVGEELVRLEKACEPCFGKAN